MKKRILTVLLAVCLVFALGTVSALADDPVTGNMTADSINQQISNSTETCSIKLTNDIDGSLTIPSGKTVKLDLNGCKITNTASSHTITVNGNLTITDSSASKSGTVDNASHQCAAVMNNPSGVVVLNGGKYTRSQENGSSATESGKNSYYNIVNHGTMTINDGVTVEQSGGYSSLIENGWYNGNSNTQKIESVMTIYGGSFSGGLNTIKNDDYGNLTINGGSFSNVAQSAILNWNVSEINGGTFEVRQSDYPVILNGYINDSMDKGQLTINAGTFDGNGSDAIRTMGGAKNIGSIEINGGTFTGDFEIANGTNGTGSVVISGATINGSINNTSNSTVSISNTKVTGAVKGAIIGSNVTVGEGSEGNIEAVASVNGVPYPNLQEAINAAQNGTTKTVTLLKNFEVDITNTTDSLYRINGSITIDGDNRTITIKDIDAERDVKIFNVTSGTVTFEDLTIDGNDVAKHGIQAFGTGTNVTLNNVTSNENTGYGVLANGGAKVSATKLYTDDNGWGGVNVDKGAKFTMNSGTLGEEFSVVVESQDNSVTSDTVANLINGTYNKIQIKTNKSDVNISGGSYTDIVGYSDSKGSYTPNSGDASVTGGTFRNNVNEFATVNYVVSGSRGYTYFNDFDKAMAYAGVGDDIDFIGSSTTRTHTVRFYYENNVYDVYEVVDDDEVELPTGQYDGKKIDGWKRDDGDVFTAGKSVQITRNTDFTVILRNGAYDIIIDDDIKHGDVSTDVSSADKGATVYIYVDPDIGYVLDDLDVYYGYRNQYSVNVKFVRTGVYSFIMPGNNVYITATFRYESLPFTDVNRSQWFYDEVYYVYTNGMMEGDSATTFNPDGRMTRAMFWAVLGRIDGATITGNDWAEEARAWAMREGVSDGTNPNDYVTREQMVTMLWRYAGEKNGSASLIRFTDADKISSYAVEAMRWAIGNGIIEGMTSTTLEPQGTATRAQCAAIFMRFDQM